VASMPGGGNRSAELWGDEVKASAVIDTLQSLIAAHGDGEVAVAGVDIAPNVDSIRHTTDLPGNTLVFLLYPETPLVECEEVDSCPTCGGDLCKHGICSDNYCGHDDPCPDCARRKNLEADAEAEARFQHEIAGPLLGLPDKECQ
jgi:hypothetical protein